MRVTVIRWNGALMAVMILTVSYGIDELFDQYISTIDRRKPNVHEFVGWLQGMGYIDRNFRFEEFVYQDAK